MELTPPALTELAFLVGDWDMTISNAPFPGDFDDRDVSRVHEMRVSGNTWTIHRDDPEFSQRFEAVIAPDRDSLDGHWEKRTGTGPWEHDFDISYTRRPGPAEPSRG